MVKFQKSQRLAKNSCATRYVFVRILLIHKNPTYQIAPNVSVRCPILRHPQNSICMVHNFTINGYHMQKMKIYSYLRSRSRYSFHLLPLLYS